MLNNKFDREELNGSDITNILMAIDNWIEDFVEAAENSEYFKMRINEYKELRDKILGL